MIANIDRLAAASYITGAEAELAREAQNAGVRTHTIGYELEIVDSAVPDIPNIPEGTPLTWDNFSLSKQISWDISPFGFRIANQDEQHGLYETVSPHARHPTTLYVATMGLARMGWIPEDTQGLVTAHVNIGTAVPYKILKSQTEQLSRTLRATDMTGGSSAKRLDYALENASHEKASGHTEMPEGGWSWNIKGSAGVFTKARSGISSRRTMWQTGLNRLEYRTPQYHNPQQFGRNMEGLYYLSRGLLAAEDSEARQIYESFDEEFQAYQREMGLPGYLGDPAFRRSKSKSATKKLSDYITPYVEHMEKHPIDRTVEATVANTVSKLRVAFDMAHLPSLFDEVEMQAIAA